MTVSVRARVGVMFCAAFISIAVLWWGFAASAAPNPDAAGASIGEVTSLPEAPAPVGSINELLVPFPGTAVLDRSSLRDVDGDGVPDIVEIAVCGSATCLEPWRDSDGDGIADWVEFEACGSVTCVEVPASTRHIPAYVGWVLCGTQGCSREDLLGDVDADGVENAFEVLICGSATCANGLEDFDGDGASDIEALRSCFRVTLVRTGFDQWWIVSVAATLIIMGGASIWTIRSTKQRDAR